MPYGLIVLAISVALVVAYTFTTNAPMWSKALAVGLLVLSFEWRYGLYLRVGLGVILTLYLTYHKSRSKRG